MEPPKNGKELLNLLLLFFINNIIIITLLIIMCSPALVVSPVHLLGHITSIFNRPLLRWIHGKRCRFGGGRKMRVIMEGVEEGEEGFDFKEDYCDL